jgi:hypothetical protein
MGSPEVYDKAKYHDESVRQHGLSEEHAANHTVVFLRWLIEHRMISQLFEQEDSEILRKFRSGEATIYEVYEWYDRCLIDVMLSEEGNAFAMHYFDFEHGKYGNDYCGALQHKLPTLFHIDYNEANYQTMKRIIDRRYKEWKRPKRRWWFF